jgi:Fic family protein
VRKERFWAGEGAVVLNPRRLDILNRLFDGFEGKLTMGKWAKISKCSPGTALRDINGLVSRRILRKEAAGGRSTSYLLCEANN